MIQRCSFVFRFEATRTRFCCQSNCVYRRTELSIFVDYHVGMMIAQRLGTVRKRYKRTIQSRGAKGTMFTKYIRGMNRQDCPVVLSITDTTSTTKPETVIQRNHVREMGLEERNDIYIRAREIYFRARRQRPVRAASIF